MRESINNSLPIISFAWSKYYGLILLYWLFEILVIIIKNIYYEKYFTLLNGNLEEELVNLFCIEIADLLAGFFVLYTKYSMKKKGKKIKRTKSSNENQLIHTDTIEDKSAKALPILIKSSILHLFSISIYFLIYLMFHFIKKSTPEMLESHEMDWLIGLDFILRLIFSKIYLKFPVHRHHFVAFLLCLIGFIIMSVFDGISILTSKNSIIIATMAFIILRVLFFAWSDVLNKILMTDNFMLPQGIMFWRGCIQFIILAALSIIIMPILYYYTSGIKFNFIETDLVYRIFMKIGFTIMVFIKSFLILKVIDKLTTQYVSFMVVAECFGGTLNQFYNYLFNNQSNLNNKEILHFIFDFISIIFILFGTLIYNEIITINRYGLNKKTKNSLFLEETKEMEGLKLPESERDSEKFVENGVINES